jgi:hypothetical protein
MRSAAMGQAGGGAGVIDEQLVAGTADPAHRAIPLPDEATVSIGKLKAEVCLSVRSAGCFFGSSTSFMPCGKIVDVGVHSRVEARCRQQAPLQRRFVSIL